MKQAELLKKGETFMTKESAKALLSSVKDVCQAEFLNLDTKQVQWLDASLEHPNLVKVPEGADTATRCHNEIVFWKNKYFSWCIGFDMHWNNAEIYSDDFLNLNEYLDDNGIDFIIWQRNPLQEKINEALSALNVNKAQLSILLGREKSYVKRLLAKGRNVTENTKTAVIDQLEQLIRVHEYETTEDPVKDTIDQEAIIAKLNLQLHTTSKLLDQAIAEKNIWRLKLQDQRNLSWFLALVVVVMTFVWIYSVWGV